MSVAAQLYDQANLVVILQTRLANAMTTAFGLPPAAISGFAGGFASGVAEGAIAGKYILVSQIVKTNFMIGLTLFITLISLAGSIILFIRNTKGVRPVVLVIGCLANTVTILMMYAVLAGADIPFNPFTYSTTFLVILTLGGVIMSILWQAVPLWTRRWRYIYRFLAVILTSVYIGVTYWITINQFVYCGLACKVSPAWVPFLLIIIYVVFYMVPFLYSLRRHLRAARGAGLSQESQVSRLEFRSIPSMTCCLMYPLWASYIVDGNLASMQSDFWLACLCFVEVAKDTYLMTVAIGSKIMNDHRRRSEFVPSSQLSNNEDYTLQSRLRRDTRTASNDRPKRSPLQLPSRTAGSKQ